MKHSETYEWPNGAGHTECTPEYLAAIYTKEDADRALADMSADDPDYPAAEHAAWKAENAVMILLAAGHIGARHRH